VEAILPSEEDESMSFDILSYILGLGVGLALGVQLVWLID